MGKARIQGSNVHLYLVLQSVPVAPIPLGEIDRFTAKSNTEIIKSRPIGFINERATLKHNGWNLSFEGGKVDWSLCHFYWLQEMKLRGKDIVPVFAVQEVVEHYGAAGFVIPTIEQYTYKNVVLYGLDLSRSLDSVTEKIEGFATSRTLGLADNTIISDPTNAIREAVFRAKIRDTSAGDIERPF